MIRDTSATLLRNYWLRYRSRLLWLAILLMLIASVHRLSNEFDRLLFDQSFDGATDLKFRYNDVQSWFAGEPVYQDKDAIYPPATYLMLWPFLGWLSVNGARWLWAATTVAMGIWLVWVLIRESEASTLQERLFILLLLPSMYATGATIGNGQLILHLLPPLLTVFVLIRKPPTWTRDMLVAILFVISLMKPAIAVPFFWIILFGGGGLRSGFLCVAGYLAVTWIAIIPQDSNLPVLISDWLARGSAAAVRGGYANIHSWLTALQLQAWILPVSLILLLLLGIWTYSNRKANVWILLGVTGYVSRFWVYHRLYDDLLVLIPMIAMFRIAHGEIPLKIKILAGVILFANWAAALAPARLLSFPQPWNILFELLQTICWMAGLLFLLFAARRHEFATK